MEVGKNERRIRENLVNLNEDRGKSAETYTRGTQFTALNACEKW